MNLIMLFRSNRGYYLNFVEIIRILWISMFRGYYLHFRDIIRIVWISWIYPHFLDIICIVHITSYLAHNVTPIFHIYSPSKLMVHP